MEGKYLQRGSPTGIHVTFSFNDTTWATSLFSFLFTLNLYEMPTLLLTSSTNEELTLVEVWGGMQTAHTGTKNESKDTQCIWEGAQSVSVLIYFVISLQRWWFYCKPLLHRLQMWLWICWKEMWTVCVSCNIWMDFSKEIVQCV